MAFLLDVKTITMHEYDCPLTSLLGVTQPLETEVGSLKFISESFFVCFHIFVLDLLLAIFQNF